MTGKHAATVTTENLTEFTSQRWRNLVEYVDSLDEDAWTRPTDPAGWTVKDHIAHVTEWDAGFVALFQKGTPMQVALDIPDSEWMIDYDAINERFRSRRAGDSVATVKATRDLIWDQFLAILRSLTDEQLLAGAYDLGINVDEDDPLTLFQFIVDHEAGHYDQHLLYIRRIAESE